jgi:hypothetical protein
MAIHEKQISEQWGKVMEESSRAIELRLARGL